MSATDCLRCHGWLGHRFFVVEPCESDHAVNGWRCVAECPSAESAVKTAMEHKKARAYEKRDGGYRRIPKWRGKA